MDEFLKRQNNYLKSIDDVSKQDRLIQLVQLNEARKADKDDDRVVAAVEKLARESQKAFFDTKDGLNANILKLNETLKQHNTSLTALLAKELKVAVTNHPESRENKPQNEARKHSTPTAIRGQGEVTPTNRYFKQLNDSIAVLTGVFKKPTFVQNQPGKSLAGQLIARGNTTRVEDLVDLSEGRSQGLLGEMLRRRVAKRRYVEDQMAVNPNQQNLEQYQTDETRALKQQLETARNAGASQQELDKIQTQLREAQTPQLIKALEVQFEKQQGITKQLEAVESRIAELRDKQYTDEKIGQSGLFEEQRELRNQLAGVDPNFRSRQETEEAAQKDAQKAARKKPSKPEPVATEATPVLAQPTADNAPQPISTGLAREQEAENLRLMQDQNETLKKIEENTREFAVLAEALKTKPAEPAQPQRPQEAANDSLLDIDDLFERRGRRGTPRPRGPGGRVPRAPTGGPVRAPTSPIPQVPPVSGPPSVPPSTGGVAKALMSPTALKAAGVVAAVGMGAYDTYTGWKEAEAQRAAGTITEDEADIAKTAAVGKGVGGASGALAGATAGAALGSVVPVVGTAIGGLVGGTLGYFGGGAVGEAVGSAASRGWKGIKGWFGGDEEPKPTTTTTRTQINQNETVQRIAGENVVPGQPLSDKQMAVIGLSLASGNTYSPEVMAQYNKQKQGKQAATPTAPTAEVVESTKQRDEIVQRYATASTRKSEATAAVRKFEEDNKASASTKELAPGFETTYFKDPKLEQEYRKLTDARGDADVAQRRAGVEYTQLMDNVKATQAFGKSDTFDKDTDSLTNDVFKVEALKRRGIDLSSFKTTSSKSFIEYNGERYKLSVLGLYEQVVKKELAQLADSSKKPAPQPGPVATPPLTPPPPTPVGTTPPAATPPPTPVGTTPPAAAEPVSATPAAPLETRDRKFSNWENQKRSYRVGSTPVAHLSKAYPGIEEEFIKLANQQNPRSDNFQSIISHEMRIGEIVKENARNKQKTATAAPAATPAAPVAAAPMVPSPSEKDPERAKIVQRFAAARTRESEAAAAVKKFEEENKASASIGYDALGDEITVYKDPELQKQYKALQQQRYAAGNEKRQAGQQYTKQKDRVKRTYAYGGNVDINSGDSIMDDVRKIQALQSRGIDIDKYQTTDPNNYIEFGGKRYSRRLIGMYEQTIKKELETEASQLTPAAATPATGPAAAIAPTPQTGDVVAAQSAAVAEARDTRPVQPVVVNAPQNTNVQQTTNYGPKIPARNSDPTVARYNQSRWATA